MISDNLGITFLWDKLEYRNAVWLHIYIDWQKTCQFTTKCEGNKSSRVCTVAQYAVLEANAKVNGRGPFSHPTPPKPLNQFQCHVKYITMSPQGVDVQNLVGID